MDVEAHMQWDSQSSSRSGCDCTQESVIVSCFCEEVSKISEVNMVARVKDDVQRLTSHILSIWVNPV